jgi:hypothetical protein
MFSAAMKKLAEPCYVRDNATLNAMQARFPSNGIGLYVNQPNQAVFALSVPEAMVC